MSEDSRQDQARGSALWYVTGLAIASAGGAFLYDYSRETSRGHTSLMFIGVPAVLAILLAMTPPAKSTTGGIMKGITFALLIVAPLLGEGYLCILMASPLFYLVGALVGAAADWRRGRRGVRLSCCALALLPLSLEGVVPQLTFDREQVVEEVRTVSAPVQEVEAALALSPRVDHPLPAFLRIGFPAPLSARGDGLLDGSLRTIHFAGAEGDPPGDLVMQVTERRPGFVRFTTVSDSSKLAQWLLWDSSEVSWQALDATHTSVRWRIRFQRQLDPAWYFIPWERFAVGRAAGFLIETNATQAERP